MKKRYKVVGSTEILGHKPGETFTIDDSEVSFFLLIGAIQETKSVEREVHELNIRSHESRRP